MSLLFTLLAEGPGPAILSVLEPRMISPRSARFNFPLSDVGKHGQIKRWAHEKGSTKLTHLPETGTFKEETARKATSKVILHTQTCAHVEMREEYIDFSTQDTKPNVELDEDDSVRSSELSRTSTVRARKEVRFIGIWGLAVFARGINNRSGAGILRHRWCGQFKYFRKITSR